MVAMKGQPLKREEKIRLIQEKFKEIIAILGLDIHDESLKDTPLRIAKMYINEIFAGLKAENKPDCTTFPNTICYREMVTVKDISFFSTCEHHFQPFFGKANIAYFPKKSILGLSKFHRLVQFHASRPQVQERLTSEIGEDFKRILKIESIAIKIEAYHLCVSARGAKDIDSKTVTTYFSGLFDKREQQRDFMEQLK